MCKVNPRVDFAFKKLFGSEENKDLLISLINSIVSKKDKVKDVILKNPYNFANYNNDKMSILDIKGQATNGTWFDIEMQIGEDYNHDKRSLYYWAKMLVEQLKDGSMYKNLTKTICINILDFEISRKEDKDYHSIYKILNEKTLKNDNLHKLFEIHYIELDRFNKDYEVLKSGLDRWLSFLKTAHEIDKKKIPKELQKNKCVVKAIAEVDRMFNEEERERYIEHRDAAMTVKSKIESAKDEANKKIQKAKEENEKALEKALKKQIQKSKKESKKALEKEKQKAEKQIQKAQEENEKALEKALDEEKQKAEDSLKLQQIELAKSLIGVLDDDVIAEKFGLDLSTIKSLKI